jgi:hypothetical protein
MKRVDRLDVATIGLEARSSRHALRLLASRRRAVPLPIAGLALVVVGWAAATLLFEPLRFAILAPQAEAGVEAASALARLFGALVLSLFLKDRLGDRTFWVAGGLLVLGLGASDLGTSRLCSGSRRI